MSKGVLGGLGAATVGAMVLSAGQAEAAVTVLGGGMAQACSNAAIAGYSDFRFEKVCTMALETENLNLRDRAGTYINRGVLKLRRAQWDNARGDFDRAVKIKPDLGEAYVNRGAAAIGAGRFADSLPDINKALELGLEEPEKAYFNRALANEGLDNMKQAYFDYQKALELSPEWAEPKKQLTRFTVTRR